LLSTGWFQERIHNQTNINWYKLKQSLKYIPVGHIGSIFHRIDSTCVYYYFRPVDILYLYQASHHCMFWWLICHVLFSPSYH